MYICHRSPVHSEERKYMWNYEGFCVKKPVIIAKA